MVKLKHIDHRVQHRIWHYAWCMRLLELWMEMCRPPLFDNGENTDLVFPNQFWNDYFENYYQIYTGYLLKLNFIYRPL